MDTVKRRLTWRTGAGRLFYRLYQIAWLLPDWLYPPNCGGCGKPYTRWCQACQQSLRSIHDPVCRYCGGNLSEAGICSSCVSEPPSYTALRSCFIYEGPIRKAIHQLKFRAEISLGELLARPMVELFQRSGWEVDLVVPVPNSLVRRKMRGYNQASLLALPVALGAGVAYRPDALVKLRETSSQIGLSAAERKKNVFGAFEARKERVAHRAVLIIDDIRTSGATMEACARAAAVQGARQVYGLTLARALLEPAIKSSYIGGQAWHSK